jgi:hypothetical protein
MQNSSLAFPDRVKLPDEILCRIIEIATTIMVTATIKDKRIKTILSKVVRPSVQIGCRIDCRLTRLPTFISLDMRRMSSDDQDGLTLIFLVAKRTGAKGGRTIVRCWMTPEGSESFIGVFEASEAQ